MKAVRFFPAATLWLAVFALPAHAFDASSLTRAKLSLHKAVSAGSTADLLKARAQFEALAAAEPAAAPLQYWVAFADWRLVPVLQTKKDARAERYAKDGLDHCDEALKLQADFAEAMALKGNLQGISIAFDPKSVMTLGLQGTMNLRHAAQLLPGSPRVWLLEGIMTLRKPAQFGGGAAPADSIFRRSIALFEADSISGPAAPDWGRDDAHLWAGVCAMELKDYGRAKEQFEAALKINPAYVWVRSSLLPETEKALAAARDSTKSKEQGKP